MDPNHPLVALIVGGENNGVYVTVWPAVRTADWAYHVGPTAWGLTPFENAELVDASSVDEDWPRHLRYLPQGALADEIWRRNFDSVGFGRRYRALHLRGKPAGDRGFMQTMNVRHEPPPARPYGVSDEEAVELCRDWMIYLGAAETVAASGDARELCDLYSSLHVAWVNNRRGNLELDDVARAAHLSLADGRRALIFVRGGVLPVARQRADALGVVLLRYDARNGTLDGGNQLGFDIRASGLTAG